MFSLTLFKDVFDSFDGANLANINVVLWQAGDRSPAVTSPLAAVTVSQDLGVAVVTSSSSCAIAVDLNMYFRCVCSRILKGTF